MVAAQCAGCQQAISHRGAGSKGGTDIWEGLAWWHAKNLCVHEPMKKSLRGMTFFFYVTNNYKKNQKNKEHLGNLLLHKKWFSWHFLQ